MNAIMILNYNDYETTNSFVNLILSYKPLDLILIVDNKSTDNSYEKLKHFKDDRIKVISTKSNLGYAYGNNYGLNYLDTNYNIDNVIISNPDIAVSEASIVNIFEYLDKSNSIACVSGKISNSNGELAKNFAWKLPTYGMLLSSTSLIVYKIFEKLLNYSFYYNENEYKDYQLVNVDVISGCFFGTKMKSIRDVGFFDESTFLFGEENILFFKFKEKGYKNTILMNENIVHHHGVSINKSIKNEVARQNILLKSNMVYLNDYLKIGCIRRFIYKMFFHIGKYEKEFIYFIRSKM